MYINRLCIFSIIAYHAFHAYSVTFFFFFFSLSSSIGSVAAYHLNYSYADVRYLRPSVISKGGHGIISVRAAYTKARQRLTSLICTSVDWEEPKMSLPHSASIRSRTLVDGFTIQRVRQAATSPCRNLADIGYRSTRKQKK